jgi:hypothetical protein
MTEAVNQHVEVGILKLAGPFWGKPRIASLLAAFLEVLQDQEDDVWAMLEQRTLEVADLVRLRVLGSIVGQPRFGLTTEAYRLVIEARALANVSKGRAYDILAVLDVLVGAGEFVLTEVGNATLFLTILTPLTAEQLKTLTLVLPDVRAAGVGFQLLVTGSADPDDTFLWGDTWATTEEWAGAVVL